MNRLVHTVMLLLLVAASAEAQELAGTFDQLRVLVKPGDTLIVTDETGARVRGKVSQLSGTALVLDVSRALRRFQESDVDTIERRGPDSLKNGALIGLAIGGGLAAAAIAAAVSADDMQAGWFLIAVPVYGGIGAGIGAGMDALIEGHRVIYARLRSLSRR
jgi:hypothetical protein